jgi:Tol biopolymer transport system component
VRKFELSLGPMRTSAGVDPVISPDGQKLAYAGADGLWVRRLDRLEPPTLLAGGDSIAAPFWSPTSTEIAFFEKRKLYRVAITGGRPVLVTATLEDATSTPAGGAWLDDGQIAFTTGPRCALHAVPSSGGAATNLVSLADGEWDFHNASPLPKGRGVLFVVHRNHPYGVDTLAVWTPGGGRKVLLQLPGSDLGRPVFSPTGHVVFHREDESPGIWAFRFSLQTLERTGDLFRVSDSGRRPSVANDGTLVFSVNSLDQFAPRQLTWVDRSGKVLNTVSQPLPGLRAQRLSPDGTRVAAVVGESRAGLDIWIFDIEGGGAVAFTRNESAEMLAGWQSDGRSIVFTRRGETGSQVLAREVTGAGQEEVLFDGIVWHLSRTGRYLLATQKAPDGTRVPAIRGYVPMKERPLRIVAYPQAFQNVRFPVLSPDDRLLAYQSEDSGQMEVYLVDFPGFNTVKSVVSRSGGWHPQWNPNGTELFFLDRDGRALMSAKVRPDGRFTEEPKQLFKLSDSIPGAHAESWPCFYDVAPDGQRFLMVRSAQNASPAAGAARTDALLVQNWIEEFPGKK